MDDLDLSHVPVQHQERLGAILRMFSKMWDGSLGKVAATEHRIDLIPDA